VRFANAFTPIFRTASSIQNPGEWFGKTFSGGVSFGTTPRKKKNPGMTFW
jgi:hypothetical protein